MASLGELNWCASVDNALEADEQRKRAALAFAADHLPLLVAGDDSAWESIAVGICFVRAVHRTLLQSLEEDQACLGQDELVELDVERNPGARLGDPVLIRPATPTERLETLRVVLSRGAARSSSEELTCIVVRRVFGTNRTVIIEHRMLTEPWHTSTVDARATQIDVLFAPPSDHEEARAARGVQHAPLTQPAMSNDNAAARVAQSRAVALLARVLGRDMHLAALSHALPASIRHGQLVDSLALCSVAAHTLKDGHRTISATIHPVHGHCWCKRLRATQNANCFQADEGFDCTVRATVRMCGQDVRVEGTDAAHQGKGHCPGSEHRGSHLYEPATRQCLGGIKLTVQCVHSSIGDRPALSGAASRECIASERCIEPTPTEARQLGVIFRALQMLKRGAAAPDMLVVHRLLRIAEESDQRASGEHAARAETLVAELLEEGALRAQLPKPAVSKKAKAKAASLRGAGNDRALNYAVRVRSSAKLVQKNRNGVWKRVLDQRIPASFVRVVPVDG